MMVLLTARTQKTAAVAEAKQQLQLAAPPATWTTRCQFECRPGVSAAAGASQPAYAIEYYVAIVNDLFVVHA